MMVIHGDCLEQMATLPAESVDSIVTDPPYGLSFMGKDWDHGVPGEAFWREALRVAKPGAHLLAFGGSRTYHRLACAIEDAGWEIRDCIMYVFGSGFPKSHDVSKAIDREAGAEREIIGSKISRQPTGNAYAQDKWTKAHSLPQEIDVTAPATDAAKQWQGWGTALKPSFETVTFATKPLDTMGYCAIMIANLTERIESCRHNAKNAVKSLRRSQADLLGGKINTAHASVATGTGEVPANETATGPEDATHLKAGTSASTLEAEDIALNTFLSWRRILEDVSSAAKTSTILTAFETTIDWKILSYCLLHVTPDIITQAKCNPNGLNASALRAVTYLNASLASCESILALFAVAPAMSQEAEACRGEDVKPNLDPCILARKPLAERTVAANVLKWGTGGVNVDGCRVGTADDMNPRDFDDSRRSAPKFSGKFNNGQVGQYRNRSGIVPNGRFPANLIHDGSDEVVRLFPVTGPSKAVKGARAGKSAGRLGAFSGQAAVTMGHDDQGGSAARFFYCAKASRSEREAGLEELEARRKVFNGQSGHSAGMAPGSVEDKFTTTPSANFHPTVKPIALMRYLCRLVTPPGGIVLDPFTGSGTTGCAAMLEGFKFIGIEREEQYVEIARKRIEYWRQVAEHTPPGAEQAQMTLLDMQDE